MEEEDEWPRRGMTKARWAGLVCLFAFATVPLLSLVSGLARGGGDSTATQQMVLGLFAFAVLMAIIWLLVRRFLEARTGISHRSDDDWPF